MKVLNMPVYSAFDSNVYVAIGSEKAFLIDSGSGRDPELCDRIEGVLDGYSLSGILLTHCHADHAAGALEISEHFSCSVYVGRFDAPHLESADAVVCGRMLGIHARPTPCIPVSEGDVFDLGDGETLQVMETPGHTRGGVCYYSPGSGILFSGDTLFAQGFGRTDLPTGAYNELISSLRRLSIVNISTIYPGHGNIGTGGNPLFGMQNGDGE